VYWFLCYRYGFKKDDRVGNGNIDSDVTDGLMIDDSLDLDELDPTISAANTICLSTCHAYGIRHTKSG